MMSQRLCLFNAGYSAYAPSLYYNQMSLTNSYSGHPEARGRECILKLTEYLQGCKDENNSYLETAIGIAKQFDLQTLSPPANYIEYFTWRNQFTEVFENQFPMSRIDHYYFLYSRKIAEIIGNLGLIECYLGLQIESANALDLKSGVDKCLKDTEYILFKLIAAAALLSSEPRHGYFNATYKEINAHFMPFRNMDILQLKEGELKNLAGDLKSYRNTVEDGYKKCAGLLKELQV